MVFDRILHKIATKWATKTDMWVIKEWKTTLFWQIITFIYSLLCRFCSFIFTVSVLSNWSFACHIVNINLICIKIVAIGEICNYKKMSLANLCIFHVGKVNIWSPKTVIRLERELKVQFGLNVKWYKKEVNIYNDMNI